MPMDKLASSVNESLPHSIFRHIHHRGPSLRHHVLSRAKIFCDMDNAEWLEVFRLFPAVETLYVGGELSTLIDSVFDGLTREMVEAEMPVLRFLHLNN